MYVAIYQSHTLYDPRYHIYIFISNLFRKKKFITQNVRNYSRKRDKRPNNHCRYIGLYISIQGKTME